MNGSLISAYSGIKSHQFGIDAISNNLANVNTNGYRASTPEFKTFMTEHIDSIGPSSVSNDMSVGVATASNAISTKEGNYRPSDGQFDMAYSGKGWFVVGKNVDGDFKVAKNTQPNGQNFFTRDGSFSRDGEGYIVNSSGYYVYGVDLGKIKDGIFDGSATGEDDQKALLSNDLKPLRIPAEVTYKPVATTKLDLALNLNPSKLSAPLSEYLTQNGSTDEAKLDSLDMNALFGYKKTPLNAGDNGDLSLELVTNKRDENGFLIIDKHTKVDLKYGTQPGEFRTFGDLKRLLKEKLDLDLRLARDGDQIKEPMRFEVINNTDSKLTIKGSLSDSLGFNTVGLEMKKGESRSGEPVFIGTYTSGKEISDENGKKYVVQSKFYLESNDPKTHSQAWAVRTNVLDKDDKPLGAQIDSTMSFADGLPSSADLELDVNGQKVAYSMNGVGELKSSNHEYEDSKIAKFQNDGKDAGQLEDLKVDENGIIRLYFSNGVDKPMGRVGIAAFVNDQGLRSAGGNMYEMVAGVGPDGQERTLSGGPILGWNNTDGKLKFGKVMYKHLEGSNTDVTRALTDLILMQKGYMMASKAFGAGDDLMKEAINLKR